MTGEDLTLAADWRRWREQRIAELNAPDGPSTLRTTHWLDAGSTFPGVPGSWEPRGTEVVLHLDGGRELVALQAGSELAPRIRLDGVTVQVTNRGGRIGVRVFDHSRAGGVAVETFEPSPRWVVPGRFEPLPGTATLAYAFALDSAPRELRTPGIVSFALDGVDYRTQPFADDGSLLLVFADATTGLTTKPPARFLSIEPPGGAGEVELDFNRASLPPCAFSDQFNCPLPPAAHRLQTAVTAGERIPVGLPHAGD
jgi:uncharacterized protein